MDVVVAVVAVIVVAVVVVCRLLNVEAAWQYISKKNPLSQLYVLPH